ncbi:FAD-dependent oxidoreductase [Desulfomonile tiedjei]|uniref:NAD(P)H-nitrite reductase n=1 Tax=Desulfomonile tiedjei (strain ATCC 49306 / DSM 6799 / DCB-1) TaxID=706587 RepID=I4CE01_DESTA|nr:FAD-dependent oxidoreductase [Desulfomonile tiedjei]AFM27792.1 NAD(P)H-nitrite reductase [Desulfomonile tiedjei DSM 6799]
MPQEVVIIGSVSMGPKAAARFKRLELDSKVTLLDQETLISYACGGISYLVGGDLMGAHILRQTNFQVLRDEKYYREVLGVTMRTNTRALSIDRRDKKVLIENTATGERELLPYDKLVLATGKRPKPFSVPGADLKGVFDVYSLKSAERVREWIVNPGASKAVIIGGGLTGLELVPALSDMWDIEVSIVEQSSQLLPEHIGPSLAMMVKHHLEEKGAAVYLKESIVRLEGNGTVQRVVTDKRILETDLVIVATGVEPNSDLAKEAGLDISSGGAIMVNNNMQTSDPLIYAGGDCVEVTNLITRKPGYFPWPSIAQRQGRVIGTNLAAGNAEFKGAVGNYAAKFFDLTIACAGLNIHAARREGFDAVTAMVSQIERAHFFHQKDHLYLELVVEKTSGRVLGIQGISDAGDGLVGRVNTIAALLEYGPSASEVGNLEIAYAPQFSAAMDVVNTLGNSAENVLFGRGRTMDPIEFKSLWPEMGKNGWIVLDTRFTHEAEPFVKRYPDRWKHISTTELLARKHEVPRDKKLIVLCKTGERSYDSHVILNDMDLEDNRNLQGGLMYLMQCGMISPDLTEVIEHEMLVQNSESLGPEDEKEDLLFTAMRQG